jgi:succinoglycan biosynthesis protein ExoM
MVERNTLVPPALASSGASRVCIAVPTFRRPAHLEVLLRALAAQSLPAGCALEVAVFDNDRRPSAEALVAAAQTWFPFALRYVHVAAPGLCAVRNAALAYARERFDALAMIDDDEVPQARWLGELLRVRRQTGAAAVIGPVPQVLPAGAPRWLRAGGFLDLPVYPDAAPIRFGYSGNCLLDLAAVTRLDLHFDAAFNFAGGEDLLFFRQLIARGGSMAFAAHAVASETIGTERTRATYVVALHFRRGNTLALCDRRLEGGRVRLALRAAKALGRLGLGALELAPLAIVRGRAGIVRALCDLALGLGALCGLAGYTRQAYRRDDVLER